MINEQQLLALQLVEAGEPTDYQLAVALGLPVSELPPNTILPLLHGGHLSGPCYCIRTGVVAWRNPETGRETEYMDPIPPYSTDMDALAQAADKLAERTRQRSAVLLLSMQQHLQPGTIGWRGTVTRMHAGTAMVLASTTGQRPALVGTRAVLVALAQYTPWLQQWHLPLLTEAP